MCPSRHPLLHRRLQTVLGPLSEPCEEESLGCPEEFLLWPQPDSSSLEEAPHTIPG